MLYGHSDTIHGTQEVNVERDPETGGVIAVWFRCAMLPFTDQVVDAERMEEMKVGYQENPPRGILAIEFSKEPSPKEYELGGIGLYPKKE